MKAADQANEVLQLPKLKFNGKNRQDFRRYWPQITRHHHITGVVDGTEPRPEDPEGQAAWDVLNQVALDKMQYYVTDNVHSIVWKGQANLTAAQYYQRMNTLLLRSTTRSLVRAQQFVY